MAKQVQVEKKYGQVKNTILAAAAENPTATAKELAAIVSKKLNRTVLASQVYSVQYAERKKTEKPGARLLAPSTAELDAVIAFVNKIGGMKKAKSVLSRVEAFSAG